MTEFLWALRFLTIIPLGAGGSRDIPPQRMGVVMALFPAAGLFIGLCLAVVYAPLHGLFPGELADALIIGIFILMTGALHLDGLADSVDGIFGGWDAGERLNIMKDSRIGTFGVLGLLAVVGLKYLAFNCISGHVSLSGILAGIDFSAHGVFTEKTLILLLMPVVGRWSQVLAAGVSPYAREEGGTARVLVNNTTVKHSLAASFVPVFLAGLVFGGKGLIITAVLSVLVLIQTYYINARTGGITGDTLGAVNEASELTFLFLFYII